MEKDLPLYIVSGFLGSGKSTFLKKLIEREQKDGKRVGVIVNEIGAVSVDTTILKRAGLEMLEVNNGSIFCPCVKGSFVISLTEFLKLPVDMLFVEASGMADPFGMGDFLTDLQDTIEKNEGLLPRRYDYRGSVCIADATTLVDYVEVLDAAVNQVKKSSLVLLNKIDIATAEELDEARECISSLNPDALVYETAYGDVPLDVFDQGISPEKSLHGATTNKCAHKPATVTLDLKETHDISRVLAFMESVSDFAIRQKGFFRTESGNVMIAEAVASRVTIEPFEAEEGDEPGSQLVIIAPSPNPIDRAVERSWKRVFPSNVPIL